jgi:hypothetical protein
MLEHPIIDVAIGLILFYLVLSLVASAAQEWIAFLFGLRSKNLRKGIERFPVDDYARKVYNLRLSGTCPRRARNPRTSTGAS